MKRVIYGSLSVITAIGTVFAASKAEVFSQNNKTDAPNEAVGAAANAPFGEASLKNNALPDSLKAGGGTAGLSANGSLLSPSSQTKGAQTLIPRGNKASATPGKTGESTSFTTAGAAGGNSSLNGFSSAFGNAAANRPSTAATTPIVSAGSASPGRLSGSGASSAIAQMPSSPPTQKPTSAPMAAPVGATSIADPIGQTAPMEADAIGEDADTLGEDAMAAEDTSLNEAPSVEEADAAITEATPGAVAPTLGASPTAAPGTPPAGTTPPTELPTGELTPISPGTGQLETVPPPNADNPGDETLESDAIGKPAAAEAPEAPLAPGTAPVAPGLTEPSTPEATPSPVKPAAPGSLPEDAAGTGIDDGTMPGEAGTQPTGDGTLPLGDTPAPGTPAPMDENTMDEGMEDDGTIEGDVTEEEEDTASETDKPLESDATDGLGAPPVAPSGTTAPLAPGGTAAPTLETAPAAPIPPNGTPAAPLAPLPEAAPSAPVTPLDGSSDVAPDTDNAPESDLESDAADPLPAASGDFGGGRLIGEGFTPFQLAYLAIWGGLEEEGIPGGNQLLSALEKGDLEASDIVAAGANTKRLGTAANDEADYTKGVDKMLHLLGRNGLASN